jgi:hypothetical protein
MCSIASSRCHSECASRSPPPSHRSVGTARTRGRSAPAGAPRGEHSIDALACQTFPGGDGACTRAGPWRRDGGEDGHSPRRAASPPFPEQRPSTAWRPTLLREDEEHRLIASEKAMFCFTMPSVRRERRTAQASVVRSSPINATSAVSSATSVPAAPMLDLMDLDADARVASRMALARTSDLRCPHCGHTETLMMPTDACRYFHECNSCHAVVRPKVHDC